MSDTRKGTAYHEAGHAVVGMKLGRVLEFVTISETEATYGGAKWRSSPFDDADRRERISCRPTEEDCKIIVDEILICLAGAVAEIKVLGATAGEDSLGDQSDLERAFQLAVYHPECEGDPDSFIENMSNRCRGMLEQPKMWVAVMTLSGELLEHTDVSGERAHSIYVNAVKD